MRLAKQIPPQIYLQTHDTEGHLLDATKNEVTWCVDRINENDTAYILATPELAELLERLAKEAALSYENAGDSGDSRADWAVQFHLDDKAARALAASIRKALGQDNKE